MKDQPLPAVVKRLLLTVELIDVFRKNGVRLNYHSEVRAVCFDILSRLLKRDSFQVWTQQEQSFFNVFSSGHVSKALITEYYRRR